MKKRSLCLLLALTMAVTLLFLPRVNADEEDIPTIFIGNEAWYKHSILPLISAGDEYLVPISVFSSFDCLTTSIREEYNCYLIKKNDGKFISISAKSGRYLSHDGERGDIAVSTDENELYVSALTVSEILEIGFEHAVFYDKNIVRLYLDESLQPLEILIDYYVTLVDNYVGSAGIGGIAVRREVFSFFSDLSGMINAEINALLSASSEQGISMTFAISEKFISQSKNIPLILNMAAAGHTFAIKIEQSSDISQTEQAISVNEKLYAMIKRKTLLVLSQGNKNELKSMGYIPINDSYRLSNIAGASTVNFNINDTIFFDKLNADSITKFREIIAAAKDGGKTVTAINALVGN